MIGISECAGPAQKWLCAVFVCFFGCMCTTDNNERSSFSHKETFWTVLCETERAGSSRVTFRPAFRGAAVSRCLPCTSLAPRPLASLAWPVFFIRLTRYLERSRSIQLSRSISCDLAAISPIRAVFLFFFALRAHRRSFPPALYGSQPQPQPQPRPRPRPRPQPFLLLLVLGGFGGARGAHAARTR